MLITLPCSLLYSYLYTDVKIFKNLIMFHKGEENVGGFSWSCLGRQRRKPGQKQQAVLLRPEQAALSLRLR